MEGLTENIFASPGIRVALPRFFQISDSGGAFYFKMDTKKCSKCKEVKPLTEFYKDKRGLDRHRPNCKQCHKKVVAIYAQTDKGKANGSRDRKEYFAEYTRERRDTDPLFKLSHNTRVQIGNSFRNGGFNKKSKTAEILGCSFEEFHSHIESQFTDGMSWDLMGEIHIDHRLPLSAANTQEELLVLNHYRNLQPLWAADNLAKSDNYCQKELAAYFKKHLNN